MEEIKTSPEEETKKDSLPENARDLLKDITDLLDTFYRLTVIKLAQKVVNISSGIINGVIVSVLGLLFLFFTSIGLALWVGDMISSRPGGFFIVAGFFLIVMFIILLFRKKRIFPFLRNMITKKIYD